MKLSFLFLVDSVSFLKTEQLFIYFFFLILRFQLGLCAILSFSLGGNFVNIAISYRLPLYHAIISGNLQKKVFSSDPDAGE